MNLPLFLMVFVNFYINFRIRQKFRILADPDPDPQHWCRLSIPVPVFDFMERNGTVMVHNFQNNKKLYR
jgi:hypothetical protein